MRRVTASLIGLLIAAPLLAQEPTTPTREHVVRVGDTLWDLAGHYYNDPFQWPAIYEANPTVVENPHLILPEERLVIPGLTGQPAGVAVPGAPGAPPRQAGSGEARGPNRTLFYRPPPVRPQDGGATLLSEPVNTNMPVTIGEFMSAPYLMDPASLDVRGVFIRAVRDEMTGPGGGISAHPKDRVYVGYAAGVRPSVGDRLVIVDVGSDDVEGAAEEARMIEPRGIVRVEALGLDVLEGRVETQFGPVYPDQLLVPATLFPDFRVEAAEPIEGGHDLRAVILAFAEDEPLHGPGDLAFLSVGAQHGVREGDVFEAFLPRREAEVDEVVAPVADVDLLPPEVVGVLRVLRVTDGHATVRVDQVFAARLIEGLPVMRVRRIP